VRRWCRLAAVYNVPLAGALFTAEILIGSISLPVMLPAIVTRRRLDVFVAIEAGTR
jgi:methylglyoxal synthase